MVKQIKMSFDFGLGNLRQTDFKAKGLSQQIP